MVLTGKGKPLFILFSIIIMTVSWSASRADAIPDQGAPEALIVVSPHPDDETIMAGGTLYRAVHDGYTAVSAIYLSSGDGAGSNGKCFEVSVEEKKRKIVALREGETREAWGVIGLDASRLYFLRYSDRQLVAEAHLIDGRRVDVLNAEGERAVAEIADLLPTLVPSDAQHLTIITASSWDAHPDHRVAYTAALAAAGRVKSERGIPVTLLSAIVHDELPWEASSCCLGDMHWPNPGPVLAYQALCNSRIRPRPPLWDVIYDVSDLIAIRTAALRKHASQVKGNPSLCMIVIYKVYYRRWMEKTNEAFWKEDF